MHMAQGKNNGTQVREVWVQGPTFPVYNFSSENRLYSSKGRQTEGGVEIHGKTGENT